MLDSWHDVGNGMPSVYNILKSTTLESNMSHPSLPTNPRNLAVPIKLNQCRQMRPEVARDALLATHGGLSLELCAVIWHISPMALYRLVCALGHQSLVTVLTRCGLPLPSYFLADEKHSRCLTAKVYLPTIVCGRVIWHLGYTEEASAAAFTQSYEGFQRAAAQQEPSYRVKGVLIDGFDSTAKSMRTLFPGARLGNCLRHALNKLPKKLAAIAAPVRQALRSQFHTLLYRARQRKGLRVFALGQ